MRRSAAAQETMVCFVQIIAGSHVFGRVAPAWDITEQATESHMLISFSHKFVFVHIPKTGGTSIRAALQRYHPFDQAMGNGRMQSLRDQYQAKLDAAGIFSHSAIRVAPLVLSQESLDTFYKFAVIRNSWEWVVSLYVYIKRFQGHPQHESVKDMSFEEYLDWCFVQDHRPCQLQCKYVTDESGRMAVDFCCRFERLGEDFAQVCEKLGLTDVALPHLNKYRTRQYSDYYTPATRDLVHEYCREDVERFGFAYGA